MRSAGPAAYAALGVSSLRSPRPDPSAAMPMKGCFPIRRTLQYLGQGDVVFKDSVKVMTVNYNTHGELGEGARSVGALRGRPQAARTYPAHCNDALVTLRPGAALGAT